MKKDWDDHKLRAAITDCNVAIANGDSHDCDGKTITGSKLISYRDSLVTRLEAVANTANNSGYSTAAMPKNKAAVRNIDTRINE